MENEFVDQHWQKIGSRALEDFRTVTLGIENQLSFPIGLSLLAVARSGNNVD